MRKVLVIDTSVLYVWLKVSGKETCGPSNALVTYEKVSEKIEKEKKKGTTFILPLATIIETENHIAHSSGDRMSLGEEFAQIMIDSLMRNHHGLHLLNKAVCGILKTLKSWQRSGRSLL